MRIFCLLGVLLLMSSCSDSPEYIKYREDFAKSCLKKNELYQCEFLWKAMNSQCTSEKLQDAVTSGAIMGGVLGGIISRGVK